jgi:hypothetical protein
MLWDWYTIDACFLSKTWHITTKGMCAGSALGMFFFCISDPGAHSAVGEGDSLESDARRQRYYGERLAAGRKVFQRRTSTLPTPTEYGKSKTIGLHEARQGGIRIIGS